jgi:hypothetical protein
MVATLGDMRERVASLRAVVATVLVVAAALASILVAPSDASAAEGTELASTTVYRFDPTGPSVTVEATYEFTNTTPDRNLGGGRVEFYYYTEVRLPIDDPVTGLSVVVDGDAAEFEQSVVEGVPVLDVQLGRQLRYDRTATITVRYRLVGVAPRTDESFTRINAAYTSFVVFGFADPGRADVRVELPDDWTADWVGDDFDRETVQSGQRTFEADGVGLADDEFFVLFTARQDERLDSTPVTVSGARFEIRSWPGDGDWLEYAERHVTDGVPVLERLVGAPWPETAETEVIEASTPYLRGYAGFYNADDDVIEVGEDLDSHTMLHELSHAWFNRATITDRWVSEGLADEIGARATEVLGEPLPSPSDYDDPDDPVDVEPFPLNSWGQPFALEDAEEYYGYRTSFVVIRELRDEIGEEAMTDLIAAVLAGQAAYPDDEPDTDDGSDDDPGPVDWREFLDLAEQVGGSEGLTELYREYVVTDAQSERLDDRDDALALYEPLAERGLDWAPPAVLREAMADWRFDHVADLVADAGAVLDVRDDLVGALAPLALVPVDDLEDAYQQADDIATFGDLLADHLSAAERLAAAQGDLADRLTSVDLDVPAPTQGEYAAAPLDLADDIEQLAGQAASVVTGVALLEATLDRHDLSVPALEPDAFVDSPGDTLDALADQQAAASAVVSALDDRDGAESLVERLGSIGADVDARLDEAVVQLAGGDLDAATASASDAAADVATWRERGVARVVSGLLGIALGLTLVLLVRMRGRRRASAAPPDVESAAGSADGTEVSRSEWPHPVGSPRSGDALAGPPFARPVGDRHTGDPSREPPGRPTT